MCRCSLPTLPLIYLSHCTCKFGLILNVLYDLVSRDVTLSTVIFLERKHERNRIIEANLQNLHIIVQLQIKGHDSTPRRDTMQDIQGQGPAATTAAGMVRGHTRYYHVPWVAKR